MIECADASVLRSRHRSWNLTKSIREALGVSRSLSPIAARTGSRRREPSGCQNNVVEDRDNSPVVPEDLKGELVVRRVLNRILKPVFHLGTRVYRLRCALPGQLFLVA